MMLTIPIEALPLLRNEHAICHVESFANYVIRHSRGGLVVVRCGKEILLIPEETWARVEADVRGILAEREVRSS